MGLGRSGIDHAASGIIRRSVLHTLNIWPLLAGCGLLGSPGIRRTWSWGFAGLTYLMPPPFRVGFAIQ